MRLRLVLAAPGVFVRALFEGWRAHRQTERDLDKIFGPGRRRDADPRDG